MKTINVLVDWGKSFVDENGSFYCGTTEEQKNNAVRINERADLTLFLTDVHPRDSSEFISNGGLYPAHNLVKGDEYNLEELDVQPGQTTSPQLTDKLLQSVQGKSSGLIVPRHVFFQNYEGGKPRPAFSFEDVEDTFGVQRLDPEDFLEGKIEYVINAKHMFNGSATQATDFLGEVSGVPSAEMNVFTLLKEMYGQGEELSFDITGVVMGICVYQTGSGIRQMFPKADINIIADAATHLVYEPLGFDTEQSADDAARRMCQQVGINYITTAEYLRE